MKHQPKHKPKVSTQSLQTTEPSHPEEEPEKVSLAPTLHITFRERVWRVLYRLRPRYIYPSDYISPLSFITFYVIRLITLTIMGQLIFTHLPPAFYTPIFLPTGFFNPIVILSLELHFIYRAWFTPKLGWGSKWGPDLFDLNFDIKKDERSPKEVKIHKIVVHLILLPVIVLYVPIILMLTLIFLLVAIGFSILLVVQIISVVSGHGIVPFQ